MRVDRPGSTETGRRKASHTLRPNKEQACDRRKKTAKQILVAVRPPLSIELSNPVTDFAVTVPVFPISFAVVNIFYLHSSCFNRDFVHNFPTNTIQPKVVNNKNNLFV